MKHSCSSFWKWFSENSDIAMTGGISELYQEELLRHLQSYDARLFFLISTNSTPHELIITAEGNAEAIIAVEILVDNAPKLDNWRFTALKPPQGFDFIHTDGPISIDVSQLWFLPLSSTLKPSALGIALGFVDTDFILKNQSVDTAYTIIETVIGERIATNEIAHIEIINLPLKPEESGYLRIVELADYIAFHKRRIRNI